MLHTNNSTLVPVFYQVMKSMEDSQFEFFLTGSRFFGGAIDESDYDFFVLDEPQVRKNLGSLGFVLDTDHQYDEDPAFVDVFTFVSTDGVIQVQLIKSEMLSLKMKVQKILFERYNRYGLPGDKAAKRELWHLTYHILDKLKAA